MTAVPTPLHDVDQLVDTYLDIADRIKQLTDQQNHIKDQLRDLGVGEHQTSGGVPIVVREPNRKFNLDRAWLMLTHQQQQLCTSPDAGKVKKQLPGVLLDQCMDPGTGATIVSVG